MIRPSTSYKLREECLTRDKLTCVKCGQEGNRRHQIENNMNLIGDHILPLALGGEHSLINMQTLCIDCNREKNRIDQSNIARFKREVIND